jgi:4-hydroxybenzoate polyprenyltransferase/phosphoserine phosphatase
MIEQASAAAPAAHKVPLCVDMDGTLLKTDTLLESLLILVRQRPLTAFLALFWALRGKAFLKRQVARRIRLDPATLPYNKDVLDWLRQEHDNGRRLLLVTGADRAIAEPVADFLCLFDAVISSRGETNLTGAAKALALSELFGPGGFDYAGNSYPDLKVFRASRAAVLVNASPSLVRDTAKVCPVERVFPRSGWHWSAGFRALRVYQWVKNLLVFVPVLTSHNILNGPILLRSVLMWLAFSLCTSAIYLVNDLIDLEADRSHETKRHRPFASGELPLQWGLTRAPVLLLAGFGIGALLPAGALLVLGAYCSIAILYSTTLKRRMLVDVFTLSLLYTSRIWAGHAATGIPLSPWLLSFSMFIFLSLAFSKRVSELRVLAWKGVEDAAGRGYRTDDASQLTIFGVSSGFIASLVLSLYINSSTVTLLYRWPILLWALCPVVLYWICRIWMLAHRGEMNEDPIWFTIRDRVTYWLGLFVVVILLAAAKDWLPTLRMNP